MRVDTGEAGYTVTEMADEQSTEIFDDLYLGLRAGGALRKQRRGEPLTAEEREALGRWQRLSPWRKGDRDRRLRRRHVRSRLHPRRPGVRPLAQGRRARPRRHHGAGARRDRQRRQLVAAWRRRGGRGDPWAGGLEILAECRLLGGCETGDAKATTGGRLPARYVIHAVGPVWHGGGRSEAELLASAHRRSLEVARELGARSSRLPRDLVRALRVPGRPGGADRDGSGARARP